MKTFLGCLFHEDAGQDLIEYALLGCFISVVATLVIASIGPDVNTLFTSIQARTGLGAGAGAH